LGDGQKLRKILFAFFLWVIQYKMKPISLGAPAVEKMARALEPGLTLRDAKAYADQLPAHQHDLTGCYKVVVPKEAKCCAGKCIGYSRPFSFFGCCLCTPTLSRFFPLDVGIPCCFVTGIPNHGRASRVDGKGNLSDLVKVDGERGTLGWFSASTYSSGDINDTTVSCYCVK